MNTVFWTNLPPHELISNVRGLFFDTDKWQSNPEARECAPWNAAKQTKRPGK
jgi:hypothetical protein